MTSVLCRFGMLAAALLLAGCRANAPSVVRIDIRNPGADATTMAEQVAYPLLLAINGAPSVVNVEARSCAGCSRLFLTMDSNSALDNVVQRIQSALPDLLPNCSVDNPEQMAPDYAIPAPNPECIARDLTRRR